MPFEDIREYLQALEKSSQLKRIKTSVSPNLEIAEIMRRCMYAEEQPALLFENVEGSTMPILGNAFGSIRRLQIALETEDFTSLGERIIGLTKMKFPSGTLGKLKMLPKLSEISEYGPKYVDSGPVMEIIQTDKPDLHSIPILKSFPHDAGKFITFGLTVTKHPETDSRNIGIYRIQVIEENKAIMHWQIHKRGAQHYEIMKERKEPIEVAIVIGAVFLLRFLVQSLRFPKVLTNSYLLAL